MADLRPKCSKALLLEATPSRPILRHTTSTRADTDEGRSDGAFGSDLTDAKP
ncbi:hypothetical protein ACWIGW_01780 [Nocardia brasiliensis]